MVAFIGCLNLLDDVPYESAEAEFGSLVVESPKTLEDYGHTAVFDNSEDS